MGLLRWLRGGDDNDASTGSFSAGLAEIDAVFAPSRRKQTELIETQQMLREDIGNDLPFDRVDLDGGIAVIHRSSSGIEVDIDPADDAVGAELDGDGGGQKPEDTREHLDATAAHRSDNG